MRLNATNLTDHILRKFTNYIITDLPSSGIWAMMSGELKIGSKYSHVACTFSHSSMISCVSISLPSHSLKTKPHKYQYDNHALMKTFHNKLETGNGGSGVARKKLKNCVWKKKTIGERKEPTQLRHDPREGKQTV